MSRGTPAADRAHPSRAREARRAGTDVVLTIEDAGKGMPQHAAPARLRRPKSAIVITGVGLASMRERLHQIGGRLEIDSAVGHTTLKAVVPVREQERPITAN